MITHQLMEQRIREAHQQHPTRWPFALSSQPKPQQPQPKICLSCGARQQPDGSIPCGH